MAVFDTDKALAEIMAMDEQKASAVQGNKGENYITDKSLTRQAQKFTDNADDYAETKGVTRDEVYAFASELTSWALALAPEVQTWQTSKETGDLLNILKSFHDAGLLSEEQAGQYETASAILKRSGTRAPSTPAKTLEGRVARVYITKEDGEVLADMAGNTASAHGNLGGRMCDLLGVERKGDTYVEAKAEALKACLGEVTQVGHLYFQPQGDVDATEEDED